MLKVCLQCRLYASLRNLLSPEQVNGVYYSVHVHERKRTKGEEIELQMCFLQRNAIKKV